MADIAQTDTTVVSQTDKHAIFERNQTAQDKDELEREDNMVVIVEYKDKRYRVDFANYSPEYQMLPRPIKKSIVLDDLKLRYEQEQIDNKPVTKTQAKQQNKLQSIRERLQAKLKAKNPFFNKQSD